MRGSRGWREMFTGWVLSSLTFSNKTRCKLTTVECYLKYETRFPRRMSAGAASRSFTFAPRLNEQRYNADSTPTHTSSRGI
uniref:Putative secreted protein n=1 Tax=Anopheles marajoara TaxID=58244 RepID=A0A2M4CBP4_9DIPT